MKTKTEFCLWLTDPGTRPNLWGTNVVARKGCFPTRKKAEAAQRVLKKKTSYTVNIVEIVKKKK